MEKQIQLNVLDDAGVVMPPHRDTAEPSELLPLSRYCAAVRGGAPYPPVILCTGRQIPYAEAVTQMIGAFFPGYYSVVENGAFLYDVASNVIEPNPLLTPEHRDILAEVRRYTDGVVQRHGARKEYGKEICISLNPPAGMAIAEWFSIVRESLEPWQELLNVTHSMSAVDITPAGIDKAAGLRAVSEKTGIPCEAMLGVGDTRGDWPMLKLVGTAVGPANATEDVRSVAAYIAPAEEALGAAQIIEKYTGWTDSH
jgi:hydroxymethylpyrimidine pyrophosphatase-like HAD family hydrolase